jgi:hypothetical protein
MRPINVGALKPVAEDNFDGSFTAVSGNTAVAAKSLMSSGRLKE